MSNDEDKRPTVIEPEQQTLLKGYHVEFEGIHTELRETFIPMVKALGATVGRKPKYIFTELDYFRLPRNKDRTDLYSLDFLKDTVEERQRISIEPYRFNESDLNESANNNSDGSADLQNVQISKPHNENSNPAENNHNPENANINKNQVTSKRSYAETFDSEDENCNSSKDNKSSTSNRKKTVLGWIDVKSSFNDDSELKKDNVKELQGDSDNVANVIEEDDSDEDVNIEETNDLFRREWWIRHPIPEKHLCTVHLCTFEPIEHCAHPVPVKLMSEYEKKILLKYLIEKNKISNAKGLKVYESMHQHGYLTHRSAETLRNCFRRTILPAIESFRLPYEIFNKFRTL